MLVLNLKAGFIHSHAVDELGNVYSSTVGNDILKIKPDGRIMLLAGSGEDGYTDGFNAQFSGPFGIALANDGAVIVADGRNHVIRKVDSNDITTTIAGLAGCRGSVDGFGTEARFDSPCSVAVDRDNYIYVVDSSAHCIKKISPTGEVRTIAGKPRSSGDDNGHGLDARFCYPSSITITQDNNIYVADKGNDAIRKISFNGEVTNLRLRDSKGNRFRFKSLRQVVADKLGSLYVTELDSFVIRRINQDGLVVDALVVPEKVCVNARMRYPAGLCVLPTTGGLVFNVDNILYYDVRVDG